MVIYSDYISKFDPGIYPEEKKINNFKLIAQIEPEADGVPKHFSIVMELNNDIRKIPCTIDIIENGEEFIEMLKELIKVLFYETSFGRYIDDKKFDDIEKKIFK